MKALSRRQAILLAVLLEADGRVVSYAELGDAVESSGVNDYKVIGRYMVRLRRLGVRCIETVPYRGYRMAMLPPDWALEDMLAMLDAIRRDRSAVCLELRRVS